MGSNCSTKPLPDTTNLCAVSVDNFAPEPMPHFCTLLGVGGDSYRNEYCSLMSTAGEWGDPQTIDNECSYNDCNAYQEWTGSGCCKTCCGIIGGGMECKRKSFTGNPITCCFNDMTCTAPNAESNPQQCYSDAGRQQACSDGTGGQPDYRWLSSTDCQEALIPYCTGTLPTDNPNSTAWLDRWTTSSTTGSCDYALRRNLFRSIDPCFPLGLTGTGVCNVPPPAPFDAEGYFWAQRLISAAFAQYEKQGFQIGALPGFPGYNTWQDFMYNNICCPFPGLCQDALQEICSNKTAQRISLNPAVAQWCGCHLPSGEYEDYSVKFNIPPECTPMCNRAGTIPIVGINGDPVNCRQNICLIDGVTVNLINAQVGGGIEFNQVCSNCPVGAQCSCVISNTTLDIENSTIGGNVVPVAEGCGSFICSQTNPGTTGPNTLSVPCGTTAGFNPYLEFEAEQAAANATAKKNAWLWTLIAIGIAMILIYVIIFIVHPIMGEQAAVASPIVTAPTPRFFTPVTPTQSVPSSTFLFDSSGFRSIEG